jgi:cobalamin biosynthesis protein CbiG
MDLNSQPIGIYIRIIAIVSLLLGLNDASRLLGVNLGAISPLTTMGMTEFVYLGIFALARLFAAVGLWIKASWGAVLLIGATGAEMVLYLIGSADVSMSAIGFAVRIVLLVSMLIVLVLNVRLQRARSID